MTGHVKIGGAWKDLDSVSVKVGGAWKQVDAGYTRIGGVWKEWFTASNPAYELLTTTTLTNSTTQTVTFSSLGGYSDYQHLILRSVNKTTNALDSMRLYFNGVTTASYAEQAIRTQGTVTDADSNLNRNDIALGYHTNSIWTPYEVEILDFSKTTKTTTVRGMSGHMQNGGSRNFTFTGGAFLNTAAITSLTIKAQGQYFASGSRFSLYGIR